MKIDSCRKNKGELMPMIKYSVIIPTYNNCEILSKCLNRLSKLKKPKEGFEVIVVDNGSHDITKEVVETYKNKIENLVYLYEASPGQHIGRHAGLKKARGEILCYIDDDSFVDKGWLRAIEQTFSDNTIHLATGAVRPYFEATPPKWFKYMWHEDRWGKHLFKYSLIVLQNRFMEIPHSFSLGCNFIVKKEDVLKYKGFNPDCMPPQYMQYCGDGETTFSGKLNNAGIKAWYNPKISIHHLVSKKRMSKEYLRKRAQYVGITSSFKDLRAEHGLFKFTPEQVRPPKNSSFYRKLKKLFKNNKFKKQAEELEKFYDETAQHYYDWHHVEFKKNKKLREWVLKESYIENAEIPEKYEFSIKSIHVYSGEPIDNWILGKFAKILQKEYSKYGINATLSEEKSKDADFNHCIFWLHCNPETTTSKDVAMITHFGEYKTLQRFEKVFPKLRLGICMSKDTMDKLIACGFDKNKLCYIEPAHDEVIPVKKWVIGLASRVYSDGRKNEDYFNKLADVLNHRYFKFKIMGANWEPQVDYMRKKGFEVEYYNEFNYDIYTKKFFSDMDYYLYMGLDEGQMGFVDAQSAGVKTIVTAQGYHLDSDSPITYPFETYDELEKIFFKIQKEKSDIVEGVHSWTWSQYALKHLMIFEYLKSGKIIKNDFKDGLNSLLNNINSNVKIDTKVRDEYLKHLKRPMHYRNIQNYYSKNDVSFHEKIFSIKKEWHVEGKRKVITILGIKIKLKRKKQKKEIQNEGYSKNRI